jgi:hypothetical protein
MKTSLLSLLLCTGLTLAAGAAYGHGDEPVAAMHGGMVSEAASGTTAELSTAGGMLMLYLNDHVGKPISSQVKVSMPGKSAEMFRFVLK